MATLTELIMQGFDLSRPNPSDNTIRVRCSQCEALVINGVPCHETGCPNCPDDEPDEDDTEDDDFTDPFSDDEDDEDDDDPDDEDFDPCEETTCPE